MTKILLILIAVMLIAGCDEEGVGFGSGSSSYSSSNSSGDSSTGGDYISDNGTTNGNGDIIPPDPAPGNNGDVTPEPGTIVLLGIGLAGLACSAFRKKKSRNVSI